MGKIAVLRKSIDAIDNQILGLLKKRGEIAQEIGKEKAKQNLLNFHSPSRELEIFKRLTRGNKGPYPDSAIQSIFREIFSATLSLEKLLKVAYLGPAATFTHLAGQKKFGKSVRFLPQKSVADIFSEVERNNANYGIVPIENSVEGTVGNTLDLLLETPLFIIAEIELDISIHLLSSGGDISKIKKICSHPHAIAQCRKWLSKNLPNVQVESIESTAAAAKLASGNKSVGALANEIAADMYGLMITRPKVQDLTNSMTRFVIISREMTKRSGTDKTSLVFSVKDKPGVLVKCLKILSEAKINMTKIESRPVKKKAWEYIFFVDTDGHVDDQPLKEAIKKIKKHTLFFKVLGSYPREM